LDYTLIKSRIIPIFSVSFIVIIVKKNLQDVDLLQQGQRCTQTI